MTSEAHLGSTTSEAPLLPPFRPDGTLPPYRGTREELRRDPSAVSPYGLSASEVVRQLGFSPARCDLLRSWLAFRERLLGLGVTGGVQWLGGSFVEHGAAEPRDIDCITLASLPREWIDRDRLTSSAPAELVELCTPGVARQRYRVDAHLLALGGPGTLRGISVWYAAFGHSKLDRWKGFVTVPLPSDDREALARLDRIEAGAESARPPETSASVAEADLPERPVLLAHALSAEDAPFELVPGASRRAWIDASPGRFAARCLPLLIANQHGWDIVITETIDVRWTGDGRPEGVQVRGDERLLGHVSGHFGGGIVTFSLPFLFRTPTGWNLHVRGPVNAPKDGISALEGVVETDWSVAPFSMSWKITRPGHTIRFRAGETICRVVPVRRGELAAFEPALLALDDDAGLARRYRAWRDGREAFLDDLRRPGSEAQAAGWQKDYFQGHGPLATHATTHETRLTLRRFVPATGSKLGHEPEE